MTQQPLKDSNCGCDSSGDLLELKLQIRFSGSAGAFWTGSITRPIEAVCIIAALAELGRCTECGEIAGYWHTHLAKLRQIFPGLDSEVPHPQTIKRLLGLIRPDALNQTVSGILSNPAAVRISPQLRSLNPQSAAGSAGGSKARAGRGRNLKTALAHRQFHFTVPDTPWRWPAVLPAAGRIRRPSAISSESLTSPA